MIGGHVFLHPTGRWRERRRLAFAYASTLTAGYAVSGLVVIAVGGGEEGGKRWVGGFQSMEDHWQTEAGCLQVVFEISLLKSNVLCPGILVLCSQVGIVWFDGDRVY
jgi:hypothetical protein